MSRTGRKPIPIPDKVKVKMTDHSVEVDGPLGKLQMAVHPRITIEIANNILTVNRPDDEPQTRALHGLMRALLNNLVEGVTKGFTKELDIQGVGYRAEVKGDTLNMTLGFSHPVQFPIPNGIKITVDKQTHLVVTGRDRALVGQVSADIRGLKPPEPYKGKGIRYTGEVVRRKAGKAAATAGK